MEDDKGSKGSEGSTIDQRVGASRVSASGRRGFLAGAGAAGVAGAAVLAVGGKGPVPAGDAAAEAAPVKPLAGRGYHETDHIRKYYDTTKV